MSSSDTGMVDRVAKAIINAYLGEDCWDSLPETEFDEFLGVARAAIEALHEPTPEMVVAMEEAFFDSTMGTPLHGSSEDAAAMFKAAIDAALSHKEGEGR